MIDLNRIYLPSGRAGAGVQPRPGDLSAPPASPRVNQVTPLTASFSLSGLAVSNPFDLWLFTPTRTSLDRITLTGNTTATFDVVTVQFIQKRGDEVIELAEPFPFTALQPGEPLDVTPPASLQLLPLFARFAGADAPVDVFITADVVSSNNQ